MAIKKANIITITSTKGGTGKTMTTLNLAGILSKKNIKTLIIDMDLYAGGIAASLGVDNKKDIYNLVYDLYNNTFDNLDDYVSKYNDNIDVLCSPKDPRTVSQIDSKYISVVLAKSRTKYDYILIDTNHILNEINLVVMDYSDAMLYVMTNDLVDIKNMKTMVAIYSDMEKENYKIVLNEAKSIKMSKFSTYDIKNIINTDIDYIIPISFFMRNYDQYIFEKKIPTLEQNNKSTQVFEKIIEDLK